VHTQRRELSHVSSIPRVVPRVVIHGVLAVRGVVPSWVVTLGVIG
jgi:hypothetical protein